MVTKRFFDDSDKEPDEPNDKRMRPTRPSLASVIGEVVMVRNLENIFSALEPLLRRVVTEEVERVMRHLYPPPMTGCPSLRIQASSSEHSSSSCTLQLSFKKRLSLPIFTGSRIVDVDGNPMEVLVVEKTGDRRVPTSLGHAMRLETVVVDGEFDKEEWTMEEFNSHIVKERTGKRPLLAGELNVTMRDNGVANLSGDIEFTDNSSWIRSRKFRVAVRVIPGSAANHALRIREAITEPFVVKDHRGELYMKHHPPMLEDEVWRLEKIGKEGAFHKRLASEGINTVQEFLKLSVVDPHKLRMILGMGMSEKMWEVTLKHARNCKMGKKLYIYRGPQFIVFLNPICQVVRANINGHVIHGRDLNNINRSYMEKLVREAYVRWSTLEEAEGLFDDNISFLTQGETVEQIPESHQASVVTYDSQNYSGDNGASSAEMGCSEWSLNPAYSTSMGNAIPFSFSQSQSDGDNITPSGSLIDGAPKWQ